MGGEPWEGTEDECKEKWGLREGERRRPQVPNGSEPVVQGETPCSAEARVSSSEGSSTRVDAAGVQDGADPQLSQQHAPEDGVDRS